MNLKKLLTALLCGTLFSCSKTEAPKTNYPPCLNELILEQRQGFGFCNSGAALEQYVINGQTFYLYQVGYCADDIESPFIDTNCNIVGSIGGWSSSYTIYGQPFANATLVRTLWTNK